MLADQTRCLARWSYRQLDKWETYASYLRLDGAALAGSGGRGYDLGLAPDQLTARLAVIDPPANGKQPEDFASLERAASAAATVSLRGKSLRQASLVNAVLVGVDLTGADLRGADLRYADLRRARLEEADLRKADLTEARLQGADLTNANLQDATARFARFDGAFLHGTSFVGADLQGAHFRLVQFKDPPPYLDALNGKAAATDDPGLAPPVFRDAILHGAQLWGVPLEQDALEPDNKARNTSICVAPTCSMPCFTGSI